MTDSIKLTIPHERRYHSVIRLVIGGLAARRNLSYDDLEDLQLALEGLLANPEYAAGGEVTVEVSVDSRTVDLAIGPLKPGKLAPELAGEGEEEGEIRLHRLLAAVVGEVAIERRDGAEWVRLRKPVGDNTVATGT